MTLLEVLVLFSRLGAVSFGGGTSVLAELHRELVLQRHVISETQFANAYALGLATPGPGVLYMVPLGFFAAGTAGAVVAMLAFLIPPLLLQLLIEHNWERLTRSGYVRAIDRTLPALAVGLTAASLHALGTPLLPDARAVVAMAACALAVTAFRASPSVVVLGAGVLGLLGVL